MSQINSQSVLVIVGAMLLVPRPGTADVTIRQKTSSAMIGGVIKTHGTITTTISGDQQRSDAEIKTKLPLISPPAAKTSDIMRLDKEVVWDLDHKKKAYTEMTFAEMRAFLDSANAQMQQMAQESKTKDKDDTYQVSPPEFSVERTGNKATIGGYACEEVVLKAISRFKDTQMGDTGSYTFHNRIWATKDFAGQAEFDAFYRKMAAKLGFGREMASAQSYLALMGIDADDLAKETAKIGGFPMKQEMALYLSGAGTQAQGSKASAEEKEEEPAPADKLKKLGGMFGKKKDKPKEEKSKDTAAPGALFSVTMEVESVSTSGADAAQFDVPAGYKKVERK